MTVLSKERQQDGTLIVRASTDAERTDIDYDPGTIFHGPTGNGWRKDSPGTDASDWTQIESGGKRHVSIQEDATMVPDFDEVVYNGTATGSQVTEGALEEYELWQFQVAGVDADDDITIQVSLDGVNYIKPGLVDIMTGAHIDQTAANIEAAGIYRFGNVAEQDPIPINLKAIKVVRETAAGANSVTVHAFGRTSNA